MDQKRDHAHMNFMADCLEIIHAQDRTRSLRERALGGDAEAARLLRDHFHLLYWEHEGRQIVPRETAGNGGEGAGRRRVGAQR